MSRRLAAREQAPDRALRRRLDRAVRPRHAARAGAAAGQRRRLEATGCSPARGRCPAPPLLRTAVPARLERCPRRPIEPGCRRDTGAARRVSYECSNLLATWPWPPRRCRADIPCSMPGATSGVMWLHRDHRSKALCSRTPNVTGPDCGHDHTAYADPASTPQCTDLGTVGGGASDGDARGRSAKRPRSRGGCRSRGHPLVGPRSRFCRSARRAGRCRPTPVTPARPRRPPVTCLRPSMSRVGPVTSSCSPPSHG